MKARTIQDLNQLYEAAKEIDRDIFAEMRSNVLLVEGSHYTKRMNEALNTRGISSKQDTKLRITKNWIHKASRIYINSIMTQCPGVQASPRNPYELQHKKSAELNQSVIDYGKSRYKLKRKYREWCSDYVNIGEAAVLLRFDETKGRMIGYEGAVTEDGEPILDEMGNQVADNTKPVMSGEFCFDRIYGHQLFRDPQAKSMEDSSFIGIDDLIPIKDLKLKYRGQDDKLKMIQKSNESFVIFDAQKGGYGKQDEMCSVRKFFFRPCMEYPKGYFYFTTKEGILEEGELPKGIFPVRWVGFDEYPTKVRATSMVRVAKPWQAEINRASSQAALHGITTADDKILTQAGTKLEQGTVLPGVRGLTYSGQPPTILPGRVGDQFYEYIDRNEQELSRALMLDQIDIEKVNNLDPYAMLFRSMSTNRHFSHYAEKFGEFLVEVIELFLEMAKHYLDDDEYVAAVGKSELINIAEFRNTDPLYHRIELEEQEDTVDQKLGRHLTLMNFMQYVGNKLEPKDLGKLMLNAPFGNWEDTFSQFTIDERNVKNDFLAIERGEMPYIAAADDSEYILAKVAERRKERDFALLPEEIRAIYDEYEQIHLQKQAEEQQALKDAQSEYIPTGGSLVEVGVYIPNADPNKIPKRARLPYEAVQWLMKQLEAQGMGQESLESMNAEQIRQVVQQMQAMGGGAQGALPQQIPA